jgi:APA family basic amino acid/polyamine antiporter
MAERGQASEKIAPAASAASGLNYKSGVCRWRLAKVAAGRCGYSVCGMAPQHKLSARLGLGAAFALSVTDMVGVGPFLTLPLMVAAMGGPPAILAWIAGGVIAVCDALVWAELAASFPRAGGTYVYLQEIFGDRGGRALSFLYAGQLLVSAPLSMASGCLGLGMYLGYVAPGLETFGHRATFLQADGTNFAAAIAAVLATALVYRRVQAIGRLAKVLLAGVLLTLLIMIVTGLTHFHADLLRQSAAGAWHWSSLKMTLGAGLLLALYDYWGYYNAALLGEEVRDPERNIPRAMLMAIGVVMVLYVLLSVSVLGVLPWQQVVAAPQLQHLNIASVFMEHVYGRWAGDGIAVLVMLTAFAGVFALLTGYSRVVFAAARDGNLPSPLARLNVRGDFPGNAVLLLGGVTVLFCFLRLVQVIAALVVIRIVLQFGLQAAGLLWLRARQPNVRRPFRMWLYPLPALLALAGFALVLADKAALLARAGVFAAVLLAIYFAREARGEKRIRG